MSCSTETYTPTSVGPNRSHSLFSYSGVDAGSPSERKIHHAHARAQDGSRLTTAGVVPDTTQADPEHIWGDEGPVNE
jgi:hypothetical protein